MLTAYAVWMGHTTMNMKRSQTRLFTMFIIFMIGAAMAVSRTGFPAFGGDEAGENAARVVRVVDGDTIKVAMGSKEVTVRYIGIDTPETVDPRRPVQRFGKEASERNKNLVEGKSVRLEKDVSETDRLGRLLRYVYVNDDMVNATLVREGFAHAVSFPPDVRYQDMFRQLEREAREAKRGLWGQ